MQFSSLCRKIKDIFAFYCTEHNNGIKIDKHRYNLVQVRNRLNFWYHQCAWLSELKSSNQICEKTFRCYLFELKLRRIGSQCMGKICHPVFKPASPQCVQQFSDLIYSLQCILLQHQEIKWTYAKINNFDPVLFICIPCKC